MSKRKQVREEEDTGEWGRENRLVRKRQQVSEEEITNEGGRENK